MCWQGNLLNSVLISRAVYVERCSPDHGETRLIRSVMRGEHTARNDKWHTATQHTRETQTNIDMQENLINILHIFLVLRVIIHVNNSWSHYTHIIHIHSAAKPW